MAGRFKWKLPCKVPGRQFTELDPAVQVIIANLLSDNPYKSYIYYVGKDYIGCKLDEKMKFIILRNHDGDFATADPWPDKSA